MPYKSPNPYFGNPYGANPYLPRMPMPGYGQPMKTPDQYQAELLKQLQPNLEAYNQQYNAYKEQQNLMNNSGQYIKVASYEEVKQIQAPSDGRPVIIIDDANGFLYSKKFDNGQEYIKAFRLVPNEAKEETAKTEENNVLNNILERLDRLEGKDNGTSGHVTEPIKDTEPTGV